MSKKIIFISVVSTIVAIVILLVHSFYLKPTKWKRSIKGIERGVDNEGNPWIGAKNPVLTIYEYFDYDCPYCLDGHKHVRSFLAPHWNKVRLVRIDYARMPCNDLIDSITTCELVKAGICASKHIDYWQWNDMIIQKPRHLSDFSYVDYLPSQVEKAGLPKDEFFECLKAPDTQEQAQKIYLHAKNNKIKGTPTYIIDGEQIFYSQIVEKVKNLK